jgi:excinuclease ABC subunit A
LATKKIVPDYITTQIDHDTGQGNRDWLAVSLWSAVTRHRFLFRTRLSLERRSCWQTRFEKESSDKSEHSKDKNDRVNPISQLTAFSTASVRLNCAFACGCLTMMELRGVRVHNLQNLDIDLPTGKLISICGVSGSGKTSLALDTLYAEGQRRYIESFSAYTRQFLDRLEKPDADRIDGLPPAIAVHATSVGNRRSTVATITELSDYIRLLLARVGRVHCSNCDQLVQRESPQSISEWVQASIPVDCRWMLCFELSEFECDSEQHLRESLPTYQQRGFLRAIINGRTSRLDALDELIAAHSESAARPLIVVDRFKGVPELQRLRDSLETAFADGQRKSTLLLSSPFESDLADFHVDETTWKRRDFHGDLICSGCGAEYWDPTPQLFSFNHSLGACPTCEGFGNLPQSESRCPDCDGQRLRPQALAVRVGGKNYAQLCAIPVADAAAFFRDQLELDERESAVAQVMLDQIAARLGYLDSIGLDYLTLDRPVQTLSGGEARRVALTKALGSSLVNLLYILDEPSAGLQSHDVRRLEGALFRIRDRGNTVVLVEHNEALLAASDHLVEIGPRAGSDGGRLVYSGDPDGMLATAESLTGAYLSGRLLGGMPESRRPSQRGKIVLQGATGHNLKDIDVEFPLGMLCIVSGVSGSGKTSLVQRTLYGALCRRLRKDAKQPLPYRDIQGGGQVDDVVSVDQSPIGKSPRSNPVTYIKAFDAIRKLFAETTDAKTRNYGVGHFSFNSEHGRCEECRGDGSLEIDMQFLADMRVPCPRCRGTRYRKEVLDVRYRSLSVAGILNMTVREAIGFFRGQKKIQAKLQPLMEVGLGYLSLGQPATTLSRGEAQRLKLSTYLAKSTRSRTLFLLDEPTAGLHFSDVVKLIDCFDALISVGHSLILVEHNLQLMMAADHIIDLGPGPGEDGGRVVVTGTPEEIAATPESLTGGFLKARFERLT